MQEFSTNERRVCDGLSWGAGRRLPQGESHYLLLLLLTKYWNELAAAWAQDDEDRLFIQMRKRPCKKQFLQFEQMSRNIYKIAHSNAVCTNLI
jgi:hypothetical protein